MHLFRPVGQIIGDIQVFAVVDVIEQRDRTGRDLDLVAADGGKDAFLTGQAGPHGKRGDVAACEMPVMEPDRGRVDLIARHSFRKQDFILCQGTTRTGGQDKSGGKDQCAHGRTFAGL